MEKHLLHRRVGAYIGLTTIWTREAIRKQLFRAPPSAELPSSAGCFSGERLAADLTQSCRESIVRKNPIWGLRNKKPVVKVRFLMKAAVGVADVKFRCHECRDNPIQKMVEF